MRIAKNLLLLCCVFGFSSPLFAQEDGMLAEKVKSLELALAKKDLEISEMKNMILDLSKKMETLQTLPARQIQEGAVATRLERLEQKMDQFTTAPVITEKAEAIKKFKEFVCKKGHLFSVMPENGICPIDGTKVRQREVLKKVKLARRENVAEKIEAALEEEKKKSVVVGASGTGVFQQIIDSKRSKDTNFGEGSLDLIFVSRPIAYTTFFADLEAIGGNGPDQSLRSNAGLNGDSGSLQDTDGVDRVSVREVWLGGDYFNEHVKAAVGKIDLTNYFDTNAVANDETSQFLSTAFVNNPTLQQPRNGPGAFAFYDTKKAFRLGVGVQNPADSGFSVANRPYFISELDYNTHFFRGLEGNYQVWGRLNGSRSDDNKGFGISIDQVLMPTLTAFARYGLNRPVGAVNKYAWSTGFEKEKLFSSRPLDVLGVAFGQQKGTAVKIDSLSEIYYRFFLTDHFSVSPHLQWLIRSSRDAATAGELEREKNVLVAGLRSQVDF